MLPTTSFTAFQYAVPILGYQSALSSVLSGALTALFLGVVLWLADPGHPTPETARSETEPASTSPSPDQDHGPR